MVGMTLFDVAPVFHGATYQPEHDEQRLSKQLKGVLTYLQTHETATLKQLAEYTGGSEAGVSARIRDLRNQFGYKIDKERVKEGGGLYQYRLVDENELCRGCYP